MFNLLRNILAPNKITIDDGVQRSSSITQSKGLAQGDCLSPTLFIMYTADLAEKLQLNSPLGDKLFYADDLGIYSPDLKDIQLALDILDTWCRENKIEVNLRKTKIMKFRKGGRLSALDKSVTYRGMKVDYVNSYEYLGITFQTKLAFTEHITKKLLSAASATGSLVRLRRVSLETARLIFNAKISSKAEYGLRVISPHLTLTNLLQLDRIKTTFYKRALCLHKNSSNRVTLAMCREIPYVQKLIANGKLNLTDESIANYRDYYAERELPPDDICWRGPAFSSAKWMGTDMTNRHCYTRATIHGFHHKLCVIHTYHDISDLCKCQLCNKVCNNIYHLLDCEAIPGPTLVSRVRFLEA